MTVIAGLVLAAVFFTFGIVDFRLDASGDSLVLENDADLLYSREMARRYEQEEFLVVTFTPADGDLFSASSIETLTRLRADLRTIENVSSVTTLLDVPLVRSPPAPLKELRKNLKSLEEPGTDVALAREEFRTSLIYRELIVSPDLRSTALQVTLRLDDEYETLAKRRGDLQKKRESKGLTPEESEELRDVELRYRSAKDRLRAVRHDDVAAIRAVLGKYRGSSDLFLGGAPMIVDDIVTFIETDLAIFGLGMFCLLVVNLWAIFRRVRWVVLPMLCCAYSALVMIGFIGLVGWEVTVVSSNFISLQLIFTMSLTIHLIVRYRELLRRDSEMDQRSLVRGAVGRTFVPCLYTCLTTIAGFLSLVFCDIQPVVAFGQMMVVGIVVALVVTFLIFPVAVVLLAKPAVVNEKEVGLRVTSWFAGLTQHRRSWIFILGALVAVATTVGAMRLEVENGFIDYFKKSTEIYRGMEFVDRELGGTTPLDVFLEFGKEVDPRDKEDPGDKKDPGDTDEFDEFDEFDEPDSANSEKDREKYWFTTTKLERIARVHDYLDALAQTGKVRSLATVSKMGEVVNEGEPLDDLLLAILFQKMPEDFNRAMVAPFVSVEHDQARINVRVRDSREGLRRDALLEMIERDLKEELGLRDDQFRLSGLMVLYNNMLQSLFRSQIKTIGFTVLALLLMFVVLFRSVKVALLAIFPNILSSLTVLGVMGLAGIPLDVMTITIVAISVGIAVDDTIHYLHRFKREFGKDGDYLATMHRCHRSIGNAMLYTTITISIGFSILCFSSFIPSILFGLLTALAMLMALVSALSLLPALIVVFRPFGPDRTPHLPIPGQPGE